MADNSVLMSDNSVLMSDNIVLIILLIILIFLILFNKNNFKQEQFQEKEQFQNAEEKKIYFKYVFGEDKNKEYELLTFSQLNFDLQKNILEKILNNESYFINNESNSSTLTDSNSSTLTDSNSSTPGVINYYKNILDINYLQSRNDIGSRYIPINDLLFAVRSDELLNPKIISYKSKLLFDINEIVNYSVLNLSIISPLPKSKLSTIHNILLLSVPSDNFNISNNNIFESSFIKDNQISRKNVKLIQIDDLPVSLIKLTDEPTNITIRKDEVIV